eukprot:1776535-Rhodomonas_salina.1
MSSVADIATWVHSGIMEGASGVEMEDKAALQMVRAAQRESGACRVRESRPEHLDVPVRLASVVVEPSSLRVLCERCRRTACVGWSKPALLPRGLAAVPFSRVTLSCGSG